MKQQQQRHILLIIIILFNVCTHMYEPISVLLLLPHTQRRSAVQKYFYQHQPVPCESIEKYKIPVLSHNTITSGAENRERISFLMRALLCRCMWAYVYARYRERARKELNACLVQS